MFYPDFGGSVVRTTMPGWQNCDHRTSHQLSGLEPREAPKIAGDAEVDAPIAHCRQLLNAVHLDKEISTSGKSSRNARRQRGRKRHDVRATFSRPPEPRAASCTR